MFLYSPSWNRPFRDVARALPDGGLLWLWAGWLLMAIPALADLWRLDGSSDAQGQVMFIALSSLFLLWRDRQALAQRERGPALPLGWLYGLFLSGFVVARITGMVLMEFLALWATTALLCWIELGGAVLRRLWFVCLYVLFAAAPSSSVVQWATRPLKLWLTHAAVVIARLAHGDVGATGAIIQVDGYQLLVSTACSGVNSLTGIYVYFRRGDYPAFALLLCGLLLPVAILANLLRILALIWATHLVGDGAVDGVFHPLAGMAVFALAVLVLFALDEWLFPRFGRIKWR